MQESLEKNPSENERAKEVRGTVWMAVPRELNAALTFWRLRPCSGVGVFLVKRSTRQRVNQLLLAGEERMAARADFDVQLSP